MLHSQPHWHFEFASNDSVRQDDRRVDDLHDDHPSLRDHGAHVQRVAEEAALNVRKPFQPISKCFGSKLCL